MKAKRHFLDRSSESFCRGEYTIKTVFRNRWSVHKSDGPALGFIMKFGAHDYEALDEHNQVLGGVGTLAEALLVQNSS